MKNRALSISNAAIAFASLFAIIGWLYAGATAHGQTTTTTTTTAGNAAAKALKNAVKSTPESISAGAASYKKYCGFCHGEDAKGEGELAPKDSHPPDLTDAEWKHGSSDGEIYPFIRTGTGDAKAV